MRFIVKQQKTWTDKHQLIRIQILNRWRNRGVIDIDMTRSHHEDDQNTLYPFPGIIKYACVDLHVPNNQWEEDAGWYRSKMLSANQATHKGSFWDVNISTEHWYTHQIALSHFIRPAYTAMLHAHGNKWLIVKTERFASLVRGDSRANNGRISSVLHPFCDENPSRDHHYWWVLHLIAAWFPATRQIPLLIWWMGSPKQLLQLILELLEVRCISHRDIVSELNDPDRRKVNKNIELLYFTNNRN
jgi:hypothetical protein